MEVAYGPRYQDEITALLGVRLRDCITYEVGIYIKPCFATYVLPDGRVAKVIEKPATAVVYIYDDVTAYSRAQRGQWYVDPETGRVIQPALSV